MYTYCTKSYMNTIRYDNGIENRSMKLKRAPVQSILHQTLSSLTNTCTFEDLVAAIDAVSVSKFLVTTI